MRPHKYIGVYSHHPSKQFETGRSLYFVWKKAEGGHVVQQVDGSFQPTGKPRDVDAEELARDFRQQPGMLAAPIRSLEGFSLSRLPALDEAARMAEQAETAREVEAALRDDFRKAMLRLKRPRERQAAIDSLEELAAVRENISTVHKHMFRDFGVSLRKNNMPGLALLFGKRVLELAPNDDHAHFNLARILNALGFHAEAIIHVRTAMSLDSEERIYDRMLAHLQKEKKSTTGAAAPVSLESSDTVSGALRYE